MIVARALMVLLPLAASTARADGFIQSFIGLGSATTGPSIGKFMINPASGTTSFVSPITTSAFGQASDSAGDFAQDSHTRTDAGASAYASFAIPSRSCCTGALGDAVFQYPLGFEPTSLALLATVASGLVAIMHRRTRRTS